MNKKIFAALASATMALSATGSLAVFAEDFDVVTEADGTASTVVGTVVPASGVKLNSEYFPDKGFRTNLIKYLNTYLGLTGTAEELKEGSKLSKAQVESVKTICVGNFFPSASTSWEFNGIGLALYNEKGDQINGEDWDVDGAKDLKGLEYFVNLETFYAYNADALKSVDLSNNTKLVNLGVVNCPKCLTITMPETNTLTVVDVRTLPVLTQLNLSGNKRLTNVTVNGTKIAQLDLSNNPLLTKVDVKNNQINTLNLTNNYGLAALDCSNNNLYGLELPSVTTSLTSINVSDNILQKLELPTLSNVTLLNVSDNELRELNVSNVTFAANATLNIATNHMGAFNLTDAQNSKVGTFISADQVVYLAPEYNGVNLKDSFGDLKLKSVDKAHIANGASYNDETGLLYDIEDEGTAYNYTVNDTRSVKVLVLKADVLNRLYNPNSGEHFYTKDLDEKDALVGFGWKDEGVAWTSPIESDVPVYRLYNPNAGDHHYTMNTEERDVLISIGWKDEGIGWYSYTGNTTCLNDSVIKTTSENSFTTTPEAVKVYREYNPNAKAAGSHNYTVNEAENDFLVSVGWLEEGTAWAAIK